FVDAGVAKDEEHARPGAGDEGERGVEDRDARPLRTDERAGDVESVLGEEGGEVVAGNGSKQARESLADPVGVAVAEAHQCRVDLGAPAPLGENSLKLVGRRL